MIEYQVKSCTSSYLGVSMLQNLDLVEKFISGVWSSSKMKQWRLYASRKARINVLLGSETLKIGADSAVIKEMVDYSVAIM